MSAVTDDIFDFVNFWK